MSKEKKRGWQKKGERGFNGMDELPGLVRESRVFRGLAGGETCVVCAL